MTSKKKLVPFRAKPTVQPVPALVKPLPLPGAAPRATSTKFGGLSTVKRKLGAMVGAVVRRFGTYVPNNNSLYNAAFSGFLAGAYEAKDARIALDANYAAVVAQADVFAQAVDAAIAAGSPSADQATFLANVCQGIMANKYSVGLPASAFSGNVSAIVALYTEAAASFFADSGGGGATSYSLDCSAGGTVAYNGPVPVPPTVFLTGTPGGGFTVSWPAAAFNVWVVNLTAEDAATGGTDNPTAYSIPPVSSSGGIAPPAFFSGTDGAQFQPTSPSWGVSTSSDTFIEGGGGSGGGTVVYVKSIAGNNIGTPGGTPSAPWYSVFNLQDASSYSGGVPTISGAPGNLSIVDITAGIGVWYDGANGTYIQDPSGNTVSVIAPVGYQGNVWNTQLMLKGPGPTGDGQAFGSDLGDTLTGSSLSVAHHTLWVGTTGNSNSHAHLVFQGRVVSTGTSSGATETAGDTISITQDVDINLASGTVTVINGTQTLTSQAAIGGAAGTIASVTMTVSAGDGDVTYEVVTPVTFDSSTIMDWAIFFFDVCAT